MHPKIRGFIAGAFDLLHPGHLYTLKRAREHCDYLVVGLHADPSIERKGKHKPIETIYERYLRLKACKYVDQVIPYQTEQDLLDILYTERIDYRFLDQDYLKHPEKITGKDILPIEFIPRLHKWSSTNLRKRI